MSKVKHYEQIIDRARRTNPSNRDSIIAECRWHIEQIQAEADAFNESWARMKQIKNARKEA